MRLRLLLITIVLLGGCATHHHIPPELQYVAPTDQENSLATLVGFNEKRLLIDDLTAFVLAVDGKRVISGRHGWSTPLPLRPGLRTITVAFQRSPLTAQTDLKLKVVASGQYQIQFSTDAFFFRTGSYCDFWIIDTATQKPVTGIERGNIVNSIRYFPTID